MSSTDEKVKEAMRLLAESGRLDLIVGEAALPCPTRCVSSGVAAVVIACSPPHAHKGGQLKQVKGQGSPRVYGPAGTESTTDERNSEGPRVHGCMVDWEGHDEERGEETAHPATREGKKYGRPRSRGLRPWACHMRAQGIRKPGLEWRGG
ncbi:hypothetical protein NDU88_003073 [Pleurodeles waltl]|uniref:Uncharacterized protein n=1 Tax=Pleurodeles waltl TaxID=8319 RepID=A0AAV7PCS7_PLEWA|nr:hypothetical protein NDU88_003073 [Pleurodeles waltl]